jgi:RNA polymerase sigma factor (sigma-70 family)
MQPDRRLVTLTREGHERAFEEIVRRYRAPLVRFASGIVPADQAEDVIQDSFVRAHKALLSGASEIALRGWLYTIVRNRALNQIRDERVHAHEELDLQHDGVPQPPDVAARREAVRTTVAAVGALPAAQRDALVKREFEGLGHDQIAADLGMSTGAVRQLIFRARNALRQGIGCLIPLPLVRALLTSNGTSVGGAAGAGTLAAATGGGGGALAVKGGVALVVAGLAIGSGVALHNGHGRAGEDIAQAAPTHSAKAKAHRQHSSSTASAKKRTADAERTAKDQSLASDSQRSHHRDSNAGDASTGQNRGGNGGFGGTGSTHGGSGGQSDEEAVHEQEPPESGDSGSGHGGHSGSDDSGDGGSPGPGGGGGDTSGGSDDPPDEGSGGSDGTSSDGGSGSGSGSSGSGSSGSGSGSGSSGSGSSGRGGGDDPVSGGNDAVLPDD